MRACFWFFFHARKKNATRRAKTKNGGWNWPVRRRSDAYQQQNRADKNQLGLSFYVPLAAVALLLLAHESKNLSCFALKNLYTYVKYQKCALAFLLQQAFYKLLCRSGWTATLCQREGFSLDVKLFFIHLYALSLCQSVNDIEIKYLVRLLEIHRKTEAVGKRKKLL